MKHRSLLLLAVVTVAILVAVGGAMLAFAHPVKSVPAPGVVATCDQHPDTDTSSNLEPVTSCNPSCPVMVGACQSVGQVCTCPGMVPGHCFACGPENEFLRCRKDP